MVARIFFILASHNFFVNETGYAIINFIYVYKNISKVTVHLTVQPITRSAVAPERRTLSREPVWSDNLTRRSKATSYLGISAPEPIGHSKLMHIPSTDIWH
jgi:hypothetical protein